MTKRFERPIDVLQWLLGFPANQIFVLVVSFLCLCTIAFIPEIAFAYSPESFVGTRFGLVCKAVLSYQETQGLGSLLAAGAGMGAIISAAIGGFRMAWAMLVVAIGTVILGNFVNHWFGAANCQ